MEENDLVMKNKKVACSLYLDVEIFKKLEQARGLTKRSSFIENILKSSVEQEFVC